MCISMFQSIYDRLLSVKDNIFAMFKRKYTLKVKEKKCLSTLSAEFKPSEEFRELETIEKVVPLND